MAQAVTPGPPFKFSRHLLHVGMARLCRGTEGLQPPTSSAGAGDPQPWAAPTTAPSPKTCSITPSLEAAPAIHGLQGLCVSPAARAQHQMYPPPRRAFLLHSQASAVSAADCVGLEPSCSLACQCLPSRSRRALSLHPGLSSPAKVARPCSWDPAEQHPTPPRRKSCSAPPASHLAGSSGPWHHTGGVLLSLVCRPSACGLLAKAAWEATVTSHSPVHGAWLPTGGRRPPGQLTRAPPWPPSSPSPEKTLGNTVLPPRPLRQEQQRWGQPARVGSWAPS